MGGGSGGSSSGQVDYPEYMKDQHASWLSGVASAMTTAQEGASPYSGWATVDADSAFADAFGALDTLGSFNLDSEYATSYSAQSGHDVTVPTPERWGYHGPGAGREQPADIGGQPDPNPGL